MPISVKASARGLEIVNKARKKKGWTKTVTVAWWENAMTAQATLKRFWRKQPIQQETFINICKAVGVNNWKEIVDSIAEELEARETPLQDWGEAPDVSAFYGRKEELAKLEKWIVTDRCRLVALSGMGGIGKTYLTATLADAIQDKFDCVYWRSLRPAPIIEDILADSIQFISRQHNIEGEERTLVEGAIALLSQLIDCFKKHRCLLILDDFDTVLQSGDARGAYLEGYEGYGELLKRLLEASTKSCLVLISREQPREIAPKESKSQPIHCLRLTGLQPVEAREILQEKDLSDPDDWARLIQIYSGNPLALQIVSTMIQELFNGRVSEFLKRRTIVVSEPMRELLDRQFSRLSELEKEIMYVLAIERHPVSLSQLEDLLQVATSTLLEMLISLGRRSLIEKSIENGEVLFALQPVVMKYITNQFVVQVCAEIYNGTIELLKSYALTEHQERDRANEFLSRPLLSLVKERLMKRFRNESIMAEHLNKILSAIESRPKIEIGHAADNINSLLIELDTV